MPTILTQGVTPSATRHAFDADAPQGKRLVLNVDVDDELVRAQAGGFDGVEKAFALVPRYIAGDVAWERQPLHWQGALDGKRDTHRAWLDAANVDQRAIADRGVAFGLDTNVGTLWLQRSSLNTPVTGEWGDIAAGITPEPVAEVASQVFLGSGDSRSVWGSSGAVLAGKPMNLSYQRYQSDFGTSEPIHELTMHTRVLGEVVSQTMDTSGRPWPYGTEFTVDVPDDARGDVEIWFEAKGESGATYFDSLGGSNFRFPITPTPTATLRFDEHWNEATSAPIQAGSAFQIAYDVDRLHHFTGDGWYRMGPTFTSEAWVSFDGGEPQRYPIGRYEAEYDDRGVASNFELKSYRPTVAVPERAESMRVWFRGYVMSHEHFDSNEGRDYHFAIAPRAHDD